MSVLSSIGDFFNEFVVEATMNELARKKSIKETEYYTEHGLSEREIEDLAYNYATQYGSEFCNLLYDKAKQIEDDQDPDNNWAWMVCQATDDSREWHDDHTCKCCCSPSTYCELYGPAHWVPHLFDAAYVPMSEAMCLSVAQVFEEAGFNTDIQIHDVTGCYRLLITWDADEVGEYERMHASHEA